MHTSDHNIHSHIRKQFPGYEYTGLKYQKEVGMKNSDRNNKKI